MKRLRVIIAALLATLLFTGPGFVRGQAAPPQTAVDVNATLTSATNLDGLLVIVPKRLQTYGANPRTVEIPLIVTVSAGHDPIELSSVQISVNGTTISVDAKHVLKAQKQDLAMILDTVGKKGDVAANLPGAQVIRFPIDVSSFASPGIPEQISIAVNGTSATGFTSVSLQTTYTPLSNPQRDQWYGGDLHVHSSFSDGGATVVQRVQYAANNGFHFLALTDHVGDGTKWLSAAPTRFQEYVSAVRDAQTSVNNAVLVEPGIEAAASPTGHILGYDLDRTKGLPVSRDGVYDAATIFRDINGTKSGESNWPFSFSSIAHPETAPYEFNYSMPDLSSDFRLVEIVSNSMVPDGNAMADWLELLNLDFGEMQRTEILSFHPGVAGSDAYFLTDPGDGGYNRVWTDVWYQGWSSIWGSLKAGHVSAGGTMDLGVFAATTDPNSAYLVEGNLLKTGSSRSVYFKLVQQPVTGRQCVKIEIKDKTGNAVWHRDFTVGSTVDTVQYGIVPITADDFYYAEFTFVTPGFTDTSVTVANPVFVLVR